MVLLAQQGKDTRDINSTKSQAIGVSVPFPLEFQAPEIGNAVLDFSEVGPLAVLRARFVDVTALLFSTLNSPSSTTGEKILNSAASAWASTVADSSVATVIGNRRADKARRCFSSHDSRPFCGRLNPTVYPSYRSYSEMK